MDQSSLLSGVAATGRPLDGYVYVQDAVGVTVNAAIAVDGTYQVDSTGMQPPFILRAQAGDGSVWYSYAPSRVPANISQLTTLVMFIANGKAELAELFAAWPQRHANLSAAAMLHAQAMTNLNFGELFEQHGLDHTLYNFFTASFAADGTGFDAVLDSIGTISFGAGTYLFHNPVYQSTFDESIAVTDPEMIGSLGGSVTIRTDAPVFDGEILVDDGTTSFQPPTMEWVQICAQTDPAGETCPAGASCWVVECDEGVPSEGGSAGYDADNGSIWSGTVTDEIDAEPLPPEGYVDEPSQGGNETPEDPGAITSEEVSEIEPLIE